MVTASSSSRKTKRKSFLPQPNCILSTTVALSIIAFLLILTSYPERASNPSIHPLRIISKPNQQHQQHQHSGSSPIVQQISLIGEHNSGTTWTKRFLERCFGDDFIVKNRLTRHKHWFQYNDDGLNHNQTLVIAQFRNPYHWITAMMEKPRRSPAHRNMDWKTFVTTPWTAYREKSDDAYANATGRVCKENFRYEEIVSCASRPFEGEYLLTKKGRKKPKVRTPWYEMRNDRSGVPYGSIVELRSDKIKNHVREVAAFPFVEDVIVVQYEQLLSDGTKFVLDQIEQKTGVKPKCAPTPPQNRTQRVIPQDLKDWLNKYADWEAEALIGYHKL